MKKPEDLSRRLACRQTCVLTAALSVFLILSSAAGSQAQTPVKTQSDDQKPTSFTVRGVVTNEYGNPDSGVSVTEKGRTSTDRKGTATTDEKGQYEIQVSSEKATLVFRKGNRYDEVPVNSLPVIHRTLNCPKGNVLSGNVCVIPGEAFLPACPKGQAGTFCLPKVEFHPAVNVSLNDARALAIKNGWVMATAEEVKAAWMDLKLDVFAYGMLADGRFAVPVQGDHPPTFKMGANIGVSGGNQGFFYVLKSAVSRTQVPPDPKPVDPKPVAPSNQLNIGVTFLTPEEQQRYGEIWWRRVMKDPQFNALRYDMICDSTPENVMLDGWNRGERQLLIDAAKLLLAKEGTPATNQAIDNLNVQLTTDPVRRWQFAPFMLRTLWEALVAKNPTQAQEIFRTKLEAKIACADTKYAKSILELWNRHIGKSNAIGDGNNFWFGKVEPPKAGNTFSNFLDTRTGGSIEGFEQAGAFDNPLGIPQAGGPAVAMLYKPMLMNNFPDLDDTENLAPLGGDITGALLHLGFTTTGIGIVGVSGGTSIVSREVAKVTSTLNGNKAILLKEAAKEGAAIEKAAGKKIIRQVIKDIFRPTVKQVGSKVAQTVGGELFSKIFTAGTAAVGIILTAAEIFGSTVADRVRTDQFNAMVNERAHNVVLKDTREYLGDNPTEMQKSAIFNQLVNMVIAEPAARGDLTLALPDIKCGPGTLRSPYNNRICVQEVKFYSEAGLTFEQARAKAKSQGWSLATQAEVLDAWKSLDLDAYAFGRTAEGTFAVPVQSDHSNFKIGPNLGAVGGNQGFFYTVGKVNLTTPDGYVRIQNVKNPNLFIDAYPGVGVRNPRQKMLYPNASVWKIVRVSSNLVRIQSLLNSNMYINNQSGSLQAGPIQPNWSSAIWKLEPDEIGAVRIQNQWYKDRYIYVRDGNLELGPIQPGEKGALWEIGGQEKFANKARQNLAKGKSVKQSSTIPGGVAIKAIDGNTDGNWGNGYSGSVMQTQNESQAWWQVDLGDTYSIDEIRIYNRTDCCRERLNNFRIFVGDGKDGDVEYGRGSVFVDITEFSDENPRVFTNRLRGRYVKIELKGTGFLSLAEVEIYGTP